MNIEQMLLDIAKDIDKAGGTMYYVGGFVRDVLILNKASKDIDVEIHYIEPEKVEVILSKYGKVNKVGASFGVYMIEGYDIDFALPRIERSTGVSHTDFEVSIAPYIGTYNAAKRRDFTINSLMANVLTGEIIDHFHGVDDITNGIIRHVDTKTFVDDPLRVFRAAQFAARFNFKVAESTIALCNVIPKEYITSLSKERVFEELKKALLKAEKPSIFFNTLKEMGRLNEWFSAINSLNNIEQDPKNHPEGNVYNHTMLVLDEAAKLRHKASDPLYFMLSALCHDLGKITATKKREDGKIISYDHHVQGRDVSRSFLSRLTNEKKLIKYVDNMVYLHMKPRMMLKDGSKSNAYRRLIRDSVNIDDLLLLVHSDTMGRNLEVPEDKLVYPQLCEKVEAVRDQILPVVLGRDLIAIGYKPGKELGTLVKKAYEMQLDGLTKDEILEKFKN